MSKRMLPALFVITIMFGFAGLGFSETTVLSGSDSITILDEGTILVKHSGDEIRLKEVRTFIWFMGNPYFELEDGKIYKWNTVISKNSFNLQKVWNKLYFIRQHGEGPEWDDTSIHIIGDDGNVSKIELRNKEGKFINTENMGIFYDKYFVENFSSGFCLLDSKGKSIECYKWPGDK